MIIHAYLCVFFCPASPSWAGLRAAQDGKRGYQVVQPQAVPRRPKHQKSLGNVT